jgi:alpha-glucosidase
MRNSYNSTISGPSGNFTVNGTLTCTLSEPALTKRGLGAGKQTRVDLNSPPYAIHNGFLLLLGDCTQSDFTAGHNQRLSEHTLATNATHADGQVELDVHNLWGLMEEKTTHLALLELWPEKRPFLISRSTFPSSGRWTGHWVGNPVAVKFDLILILSLVGRQLQPMVLSASQHRRT